MLRSYSEEKGGWVAVYLPMWRSRGGVAGEKDGGACAPMESEVMGKLSAEGSPPPREMRPGVLRCRAACLRTQGSREAASEEMWWDQSLEGGLPADCGGGVLVRGGLRG